MKPSAERRVLLLLALLCLAVSRVGAAEPGTWVLEVAPIFIALPILVATAGRFPLTPLAYRLLFVHALILMVGRHQVDPVYLPAGAGVQPPPPAPEGCRWASD